MNAVIPLYRSACPGCGGDATSIDIETHGLCEKCALGSNLLLETLKKLVTGNEEEFELFFEKATGLRPWGAQKQWLRRLLRGDNTALIAPTGVGKSTLLIAYALYLASKGKRVLYVTPTRSLVRQTCRKVEDYAKHAALEASSIIVCYDSSLSKGIKEMLLERIKNGDFKLLVTTSNFLRGRLNVLLNYRFDTVIVDDVDCLVRSVKSVYNLIRILGYSEKSIELAKKRINLLWKILVSKARGKNINELVGEFVRLDKELEVELSSCKPSQLVVASATGRSRGAVGKLLRDLLKVDFSGVVIYGRNVTDSYMLVESPEELINTVLSAINKLGGGCIIYVAPHHPYRAVYEGVVSQLIKELEKKGFKVSFATPKTVIEFTRGALDVLVGYSTYYGISVRGVDAPVHVKYTVFIGTPVFAITLENLLAQLNMLSRVLVEVSNKAGDQILGKVAQDIRKKALTLSPSEKSIIRLCLLGKIPEASIEGLSKLSSLYKSIKDVYTHALSIIKGVLDRDSVLAVGSITLVRAGSRYLALVPDVMTYIQASGRASRLVGNRMTHGFSLIVELHSLKNLLTGLEQRLKFFTKGVEFRRLKEISLESESTLIRNSREGSGGVALAYRSILLIVESPTKAKTIARFFGRPSARKVGNANVYSIPVKIDDEIIEFNVVATHGHIYDLTVNDEGSGSALYGIILSSTNVMPIYSTIRKCRICGTQFVDYEKCPRCHSTLYSDSKYTIAVLRKLASEVDEVYIATDPDLEGEKIAYDVYVALHPFNKNIWRIELHEITLRELLKAIRERRKIERKLVEAEMYRRMLDRLLGFSLSQKLQKIYGFKHLGAGRVQTPVLGLIVKRYKDHVTERCKKVVVAIEEPVELAFSFYLDKFDEKTIEKLKNVRELTLVKQLEEVVEVSPKPPYTTDELLAETSKYGIPVDTAMRLAQDLFESGLITYHRTDCTYVSSTGIGVAAEYLSSRGLEKYFKPSHWGVPGAHEAIRPIHPLDPERLLQVVEEGVLPVTVPLTNLHLKVYRLIFKRFIASQMKPFKAIKCRLSVKLGERALTELELFTDIIEDGFNLVTPTRVLSSLKAAPEEIIVKVRDVKVVNSSKVPLYSSGDVVLLMKKLDIGRPSTYSKIISSIKRHGYVIESKVKKKLIPTSRGIEVYSSLSRDYPNLVSIEVTRRMESIIDMISRGEVSGYEAVLGVLSSLANIGLVELSLIPPLNLNGNIGLYFAFNNVTTN